MASKATDQCPCSGIPHSNGRISRTRIDAIVPSPFDTSNELLLRRKCLFTSSVAHITMMIATEEDHRNLHLVLAFHIFMVQSLDPLQNRIHGHMRCAGFHAYRRQPQIQQQHSKQWSVMHHGCDPLLVTGAASQWICLGWIPHKDLSLHVACRQ